LVVLAQLANSVPDTIRIGFSGTYRLDVVGSVLKTFIVALVLVSLFYAREYFRKRGIFQGEHYPLVLFATLGMMMLVSSNNLLMVYLGLELLSLSLYALVALQRDSLQSSEAAMKYFVLGAMASGFLLYGMSMLYGATGTLDVNEVALNIASGRVNHQVLVFGLVFVVAGLAFKLGVVPFHMWIPDVYQGAPTAVTLLIGGAPKLAAFAIVIRLLVEGMLPLAVDWQQMLMLLSIASLLVGNLAAIAQTNLKRMLAFSTISQMGFVLLGLMSGVINGNSMSSADAYGSSMFYIVTYVLTTLATFGVILLLSRKGFESEEISDFAGLNQRSPMYAAVMAVCLFSLAGIPPMVGFYAKLSVLQALVSSGEAMHIGLAVFAVMMSLVGAFYYLRVVKVMYFDAPVQTEALQAGNDVRVVLSINGALVLVLGLFPGGLMALCARAVSSMMAG
jgi:NADH-quinone oxidoreductase subunit N